MTRVSWPLIALFCCGGLARGAESEYQRDIRPLLAAKCVSCHGPVRQEAGLRLDAGVLIRQGGEQGPIALSTDPDASPLLRRVTSERPEERMPPPAEGAPLTAEQIAALRAWIAAGLPSPDDEPVLASVRDHWAYRPIVRPELPPSAVTAATQEGTGASAAVHPLDRLLTVHHMAHELSPLPPADPDTLLRRVTFDLIGLPPTIDEQDRFRGDHSPEAYERLVNDLLARPQHGERWARHWMDVWRYSDWDGYKEELRSSQRHIWQWRDWIVESLNANKPYDRMIVEMLAGDELAPKDRDVLRATGFLARNHHASNRNIWLDGAVEHTAKAFLGMTLNCARCHDHKYDPLVIGDYYAFRAIFEPYKVRTDRLPGERDVLKAGLPRAYDADLDAPTYVYLMGDEKHPDKEHPVAPAVPKLLDLPFEIEAVALPAIASFPSLAEYVAAEDLAAARARVAEKLAAWQGLQRPLGSPLSAGDSARAETGRPPSPELPTSLSPELESAARSLRAAELELAALEARWSADRCRHGAPADALPPDQLPLLRVQAAAAERAAALAAAERDLWSALLKHRAIYVGQETDPKKRADAIQKARDELQKADDALAKARENSAKTDDQYTPVGPSYPQTSTGRRLALARWIANPHNPLTPRVAVNYLWLHHFGRPLVENVFDFGLRSPRPPLADVLDWLAAELVDSGWDLQHLHRVIVTSQAYQRASSAETSLLAHNVAVDPDNVYWWRADVRRLEAEVVRDSLLAVANKLDLTLGGPDLDQHDGEKVPRRSLYFRHAYEKQMTLLTTFDAANPTDCYRRSTSIVPQQALALSNSGLAVAMARAYVSARSTEHPDASDHEFVTIAFRSLLARAPEPRELEACVAFLGEQQALLADTNRLTAISSPLKATVAAAESPAQRARENLVHVLMNHNDFVTLR